MKKDKLFLILLAILISFDFSVFTSNVRAEGPPITTLPVNSPSYPTIHDDPGGWKSTTVNGYWVRTDTNNQRAIWHSNLPEGVELAGIGLDSPTAYTPPSGYEIHSILAYPVYLWRTYDVQRDESGCDGGAYSEDRCNPFYFQGDGEDNRWAKYPNIATKSHWKHYDGDYWAFNDNLNKTMFYYRFRTAQLRKQGDINGHDGTPWYKYDFKIKKIAVEKKLEIEPPSRTVRVGHTTNYTLWYTGSDGVKRDVTNDPATTWYSDDIDIATKESAKGVFKGKAVGNTSVTANYGTMSANADLRVIADQGLWIDPPEITVRVGETADYKALYKALDNNIYDKTKDAASTWTVGNSTIATVSSTKGRYTGKKVGQTTVKVTYGALDATAILKVIDDSSTPNPDPDPDPGGGDGSSGCQNPNQVPPRYEYELDLEVTRIDARTVDKGSPTQTDVYVERNSFSSSRNQAKNEFTQYISQTEAQKADCETKKAGFESEKANAESQKASAESQKASAESQLASAQASLASCEATPPDEEGNTPDCSGYSSSISSAQSQIASAEAKIAEMEAKIAEMEAKIADAESYIALYTQKIQQANTELQYINTNESTYSNVSPQVRLRYGNSIVGTITVSLSEGEGPKRYTFPNWNLPDDGTIMAQINETGPYNEFTYQPLSSRNETSLGYNNRVGNRLYPSQSNNWKSTPIYVATYATSSCPAPGQYFQTSSIEGVVRTVNDNGNTREIKERVTTSFSLLPRSEMRAGYGFEYRIKTAYQNFDTEPNPSNATGTKSVESYFPTLVNYLPYTTGGAKTNFNENGQATTANEGYRVPQQTSNPSAPRNETREWHLPAVAIEEYSGNVFAIGNNDYQHHPERNHDENLLMNDKQGKPLQRWYVDFTQPDGYYEFKVRSYDAGVNHLNTCQTGRVLVDGSIIGEPTGNDDYVKRTVTPGNPFPGGIGWNWTGKEDSLLGLNDWYSNWYSDPSEIPSSQYSKTYYLTIDKIREIKNYNEQNNHQYKLGNPIFNSINIPSTK